MVLKYKGKERQLLGAIYKKCDATLLSMFVVVAVVVLLLLLAVWLRLTMPGSQRHWWRWWWWCGGGANKSLHLERRYDVPPGGFLSDDQADDRPPVPAAAR